MFGQASFIGSIQLDWFSEKKKRLMALLSKQWSTMALSTVALVFVGNCCRWAPNQPSSHYFFPHIRSPDWFLVFLRAYCWRCRIILQGAVLVGHLGFCFVGHLRLVPALPVLQFYFKLHTLCFWLRFGCPRRCLWRFGGVSNDLSEGQRGGVAGNWFVGLKILFFS